MNHRNVKVVFGNAVREKRLELGFSQEALAEASGLHRTYVSDVERGLRNISMESIEKIARALKLSVSSLFDRAGYGASSKRQVEILLVEDNLHDLKKVREVLRKASFANRFHIARNSAEALEYLFGDGVVPVPGQSKPTPKLVLVDLELPRWDGLEVLDRMRNDPRTRTTPVIALTSSTEQNEILERHKLGVSRFIVKPVTFERFVGAVKQLGWQWVLLDQPPIPED